MGAFEALDPSHHDEIHYTEFLAAMVSSRIQLHDDLLQQAFKRFDTDNQGQITAKNLRDVLGDSFEGEDVDKMLGEADTNHDGHIDYSEWIAYLRGGDATEHHKEAALSIIDKSDRHAETRRMTKKPNESKAQKKCCIVS